MLRLERTKASLLVLLLLSSLFFGFIDTHRVFAGLKAPDSTECVDIVLVFTRGSGQNQSHELIDDPLNHDFSDLEPESYAFFNGFKEHLSRDYPHIDYKAVSIHNFPDKYDLEGYKAAPVGLEHLANSSNADISAIPGEYRESVEHGINETVGYLEDQISSCPNQSLIVGGYSQGAQVMGESLFRLTSQERAKILGVGFFGDPKYIGAKGDSAISPFDESVSYPWRRGDATNKDTGMLDPRVPYVPDDMATKTASYCFKVDLVCAGWTGFRGIQDTAHASYGAEPMRNTVNELMQWAAPVLGQTERGQGGFDTTTDDTSLPPPDEKKRNVMFLLNDDSLSKALYEFRYDTDIVMSPISQRFPNTYYAAKGFGEGDEDGTVLPRVNNIQSFLPYFGYNPAKPMDTTSNLYNSFAARYPFGQPYTTGGDFADPHGLAVERAAFDGGWQADAEKHIVLITDRAPKTSYSYNICHATVRSWLQIPNTDGNSACFINAGKTDIWPKVQHPEMCETVYKAVLQEQCKNPVAQPTRTHFNTRTLDDAIIVAQTQHIAVDVVIPYKVTNQYDPTVITRMQADLEYLAKATGGNFIYYNQREQFDRATYTDMMLRIFGHKPKDIVLGYKEALNGRGTFNQDHVLGSHTNQPVILDASQGTNVKYTAYKWDYNSDGIWDETSPGPVTEHTFDMPQKGFVRVAAVNEADQTVAETHLAVDISPGDPPVTPAPPAIPTVIAQAQADESIQLTWQSSEEGRLVIFDPTDHVYIADVPLKGGILTIPPGAYNSTTLEIRTLNDLTASEAQIITILPIQPIPIDTPPEIVEQPPEPQPDNIGQPPVQQTDPTPLQGSDSNTPPVETSTDPTPPSQTNSNQEIATLPDPTLCYKLQQCLPESVPEHQQLMPIVQNVPAASPLVAVAPTIEQGAQQTPSVEGVSETKPQQNLPVIDPSFHISPSSSSPKTTAWLTMLVIIILATLGLWRVTSKLRR